MCEAMSPRHFVFDTFLLQDLHVALLEMLIPGRCSVVEIEDEGALLP